MPTAPRLLPLLPLLPALLVATACSGGSGGSSPTSPSGSAAGLTTSWGTVVVYTNGNAFDADRAAQAIEQGYARARAQVGGRADAVNLRGLAVSVQPGPFSGAVGEYHPDSDMIEIAQGVENVLTHELQHRFCHALGKSGSCCTLQDHSPGYDLLCRPR